MQALLQCSPGPQDLKAVVSTVEALLQQQQVFLGSHSQHCGHQQCSEAATHTSSVLQEAMLQPLQSPLACHTSPFSHPVPATAESTPSLLTSLSAGASLDAAHSCQVKDSALGTAVELSRSAACLSLRTAAATQRRLFTDSANLDNDDGVVLNRVNKGSLEHRRVSRCSRDMVSPAVGQRQMSTAALLGAALASQQSLQRLPPAVPHSTMAPITAVLVVMLLAIIAVCATHYVRVRRGIHASLQQCMRQLAGPSPCLPACPGSARGAGFAKQLCRAAPVIAWHRLLCTPLCAAST